LAHKEYTLDELVKLTGFSKRQIRYYITEKLVPGAGDQLGPYAAYGEETLQKLEMIKILKARQVGPTGRTMSLAEIRHSLDNMPEAPRAEDEYRPPEGILCADMGDLPFGGPSSASEYLADLCEETPSMRDEEFLSLRAPQIMASFSIAPVDDNPLDDLLQSLHSLLVDLGSDTRIESQAGKGESWRRVTSPDVEIQVRTPDTLEALGRLKRMAAQLGRLLAREER